MTGKNKNFSKGILLDVFIIILLCGFAFYYLYKIDVFRSFIQVIIPNKGYGFISPLLKYEEAKIIENTKRPFYKNDLESIITGYLSDTGIKNISLYFMDLVNGFSFGVDDRELFKPASLTKVPTLMAILKKAQKEPGLLKLKIKSDLPDYDYVLHYPPLFTINDDAFYTIDDLLVFMTKYSDNRATYVLWNFLSGSKIGYLDVYSGMKIIFSGENVEVVDYSALFRSLYNSSYLNKKMSDYALYLLSKIVFEKGLRFGVPENIKIAHKFGEYSLDDITKQLHDCGIIYYPKHPYILCIMTRGSDYKKLEYVIGSISKYVFESIDASYSKYK